MPLPSLLVLLVAAARADDPHASPLHMVSPADHEVYTDWSAPVDVSGGLNVKPETFGWYTCEYVVDGVVRYTGTFGSNGLCNASLNLAALAPGRHKLSLRASAERLNRSYEMSIALLMNGTPDVTAEVEGSCVPEASSPEFVFDVFVDDAFWGPPDDREIVLPLDLLSHKESLTILAEIFAPDGTLAGSEARGPVETDSDGHYSGTMSVTPSASAAGPYSWRITVTDPPGAVGTFPADGSTTGALLVDAPPVATWYDTVPEAGDDPVTALAWSNDADHSPYGVQVHLTDEDSAVAEVETILLMPTTTGTVTELSCADHSGSVQYCSGGGGDWLLELPTADLAFDTYDVALLTADTCVASDSLALTIAADGDVDNDRDGVDENGVGPLHDCDDDDPDNVGGADAVDASGGNETDLTAAAMAGDTSAGFTAEGNLHNAGDVDWWAFEVSGDGTRAGENASFTVELIVPSDGTAPYGAWGIAVETNVYHGTTPDSDPAQVAALSVSLVAEDCSAGSTCVLTVDVAGQESIDQEWYWWVGISGPSWSPAMCGDFGAAYTIQVRE